MDSAKPWYLNNTLMLVIVLGGFALGGATWLSNAPEQRAALAAWIQPAKEPDPHAGHDHGHEGHDHGSTDSLEMSQNGLKNIGYRPFTVETGDFEKKLTLPATVVDRPGHTQIQIPAPMTGIVTRIYPIQGAAVKPGSPLFELRLTHEELVAAQRDFLRSAENIDVVNREIKRLESIGEGTLAGKRILEQQYEKQKLEASFHAERQSLLLHGISEAQIDEILKNRKLLNSLTVYAPEQPKDTDDMSDKQMFLLQELPIKLGQQVEAGQPLAVLANHALLYLEGRGFENDLPALRNALANGWKVTAIPNGVSSEADKLQSLEMLYLSDHVETETRGFNFYLLLPNTIESEREAEGSTFLQWKYRPGQRMELLIPVQKWEEKIVLPVDAVAADGAENYIFAENGKKFDRVSVHVEYRDLEHVVIENDGTVFPGTIVAARGAYQMQLALKNKAGGAIDPHAGHNH